MVSSEVCKEDSTELVKQGEDKQHCSTVLTGIQQTVVNGLLGHPLGPEKMIELQVKQNLQGDFSNIPGVLQPSFLPLPQ